MSKVDWKEAPQWAEYCGYFKIAPTKLLWGCSHSYKYFNQKGPAYGHTDQSMFYLNILEYRPTLMQEETYILKLDPDSMNEAVVKFLVQCYLDNQMFREDDGIQDSILDVIKFCTTASEYDSILVELGIE